MGIAAAKTFAAVSAVNVIGAFAADAAVLVVGTIAINLATQEL